MIVIHTIISIHQYFLIEENLINNNNDNNNNNSVIDNRYNLDVIFEYIQIPKKTSYNTIFNETYYKK